MNAQKQVTEIVNRKVLTSVVVFCVVFSFAEFTYEKHPHIRYEGWTGFFVVATIAATLLMIALSSLMRGVLEQEAGYYDD